MIEIETGTDAGMVDQLPCMSGERPKQARGLPWSGQHDYPGILQGLMHAMDYMTKKHGGLKPNERLNESVVAAI